MERLSEHDRAILDVIFDPLQLTLSSTSIDETHHEAIDTTEDPIIVELIKRAIDTADDGQLEEALKLFDVIKLQAPNNPTVLNNRAQALRLARRTDEAIMDLNEAVFISEGQGKAGIKALCQRGLLHRLAGHEDEAKRDFKAAAKHGSVFARTQLVNLNPYAAMCNAMLHEINANSESYPL